jgi:hypothetical protein
MASVIAALIRRGSSLALRPGDSRSAKAADEAEDERRARHFPQASSPIPHDNVAGRTERLSPSPVTSCGANDSKHAPYSNAFFLEEALN